MKILARLLLPLFVLVLAGGFSYTNPVFAQSPPPPARDVDQTDMQSVADFVERAKAAVENSSRLQFRKQAKQEGPWKSGSTYFIIVDGDVAVMHANDPEAEDRNIRTSVPDVARLLDALSNDSEMTECIMYDDHEGAAGRYACAVAINASIAPGVPAERAVLIGGLHHGKLPEEDFNTLPGSDYPVETEASEVVDAETLKSFVRGAVEAFKSRFNVTPRPANLQPFRPLLRRTDGPWRHGDIYLFIMLDNNQVIFNANDPALEDTSLDITDINNCNVGEEIIRVIRGQDRECPELGLLPENSEGFVEYRWDNPDDPNDDDLRFKEGGRKDLSPGTTPKLSYVESYETPRGVSFIVGAGVYPSSGTGTDNDNDGCAIAGHPNNPKNTLFNLFLIGFALVAAVFFGNRFKEQETGRNLAQQ